MKKFKRLFAFIAFIFCMTLVFSCLGAQASNLPRLVDEAGILTPEEEELMSSRLDRISEEYGHDVVVVSVTSLDGNHPEAFAKSYFEDNGYGAGETKSGIILLVCINSRFDRDYAIIARGRAKDIFDESALDNVEDAFLDAVEGDNYYDMFEAFADACAYEIKYEKLLPPVWIFISLIAGVVIATITLKKMKAKHKNVGMQKSADSYILRDTFRLDRSRDIFLYSHITRVAKPKNNSSSRGFSGGGGGGRSGKF